MPTLHFSTPVGRCGVAWNEAGQISGFRLPGDRWPAEHRPDTAAPEQEAPSAAPGAGEQPPRATVPPFIAALVTRVQLHLAGQSQDFRDLPLAWERVTPFQAQVLRATAEIPPGQALTYGELAARLGAKPGAARAIGGALGANPWPLLVPCHRVVGAGGKLTGFSSRGGVELKARLLALEGYAWA